MCTSQKDIQNLEKQEKKKKSFQVISSVTQQKSSLVVSKYMNLALITCNKLDPRG